jgi:hypothetical protein
MSQENQQVLQRFTDAFNRRDVPVFLKCCDLEIEIEGGQGSHRHTDLSRSRRGRTALPRHGRCLGRAAS